MYLLTQLWLLLGAALIVGTVFGFALKRLLVHRRLVAVQHGAWTEQQAHAATMERLMAQHREALEDQAAGLARSFDAALAAQAEGLEAERAQAIEALQARARDDLAALVRAHDDVQVEARLALQQARRQCDTETSTRADREAELARLGDELEVLRLKRADTIAGHEQALADVMAEARTQCLAQLAEQALAFEHRLAAERDARVLTERQRDDDGERLQREAAQLREQFDALLVELSAAARARDAREAQRAQLAQQLAIETAARRRESEIALAQREQLRRRVAHLQHDADGRQAALRAECDALMAQLLASRRLTQAAVLAARQREADVHRLRGQLGGAILDRA